MRVATLITLFALPALAAEPRLEGVVEERLEAGGYVYLRVKCPDGSHWTAVPSANETVGSSVAIDVQAWMTGFESKTLKRKFERIAFGTVFTAAVENPHLQGLPKSSPETPALEGIVIERLDAAGYSYLRLKAARGEEWAAVPKSTVEPGARVRVLRPQPMDGFESKTLKRRFEHIVFGTLGQ